MSIIDRLLGVDKFFAAIFKLDIAGKEHDAQRRLPENKTIRRLKETVRQT